MCVCVCVCIRLYIYTCLYVCVCACVCVCMYIYTRTRCYKFVYTLRCSRGVARSVGMTGLRERPHIAVCVLMLLYMCPHPTISVLILRC